MKDGEPDDSQFMSQLWRRSFTAGRYKVASSLVLQKMRMNDGEFSLYLLCVKVKPAPRNENTQTAHSLASCPTAYTNGSGSALHPMVSRSGGTRTLLGAPGLTTRNKNATRNKGHRY